MVMSRVINICCGTRWDWFDMHTYLDLYMRLCEPDLNCLLSRLLSVCELRMISLHSSVYCGHHIDTMARSRFQDA